MYFQTGRVMHMLPEVWMCAVKTVLPQSEALSAFNKNGGCTNKSLKSEGQYFSVCT